MLCLGRPTDSGRRGDSCRRRRGGIVKRIGALVLAIGCFALGAAVQKLYDVRITTPSPQVPHTKPVPPPGTAPAGPSSLTIPIVDDFDRSKIDFSKEPFWAWARTEPPKAGEKA